MWISVRIDTLEAQLVFETLLKISERNILDCRYNQNLISPRAPPLMSHVFVGGKRKGLLELFLLCIVNRCVYTKQDLLVLITGRLNIMESSFKWLYQNILINSTYYNLFFACPFGIWASIPHWLIWVVLSHLRHENLFRSN